MTLLTLILLIFVSWIAAVISGIAGFGGSLIILPVFSILIGAKKAIPILTIAWMMGNASRAILNYKEIHWKPVIYFCIGAVPSAVIGSMLFVDLPVDLIMKAIGVFLLIIVLLRNFKIKYILSVKLFILWGALVGFFSAILGSAGPIGAVAFLGLNLAPCAYVASEAVTAVVMHLTKTVVYQKYSLLTLDEIFIGIILGIAMVLGSWTAKNFIKKMSGKMFGYFVDSLLIIAAISLFVS